MFWQPISRQEHEGLPRVCEAGFDLGGVEQHWVKKFLAAVAEPNIEPLREIDLPVTDLYNSHWSTTGESTPDHLSDDREVYLPGRNLLLLAKTSLYCALNEIPSQLLGPSQETRFQTAHRNFFAG